jgi:hypothetical protein
MAHARHMQCTHLGLVAAVDSAARHRVGVATKSHFTVPTRSHTHPTLHPPCPAAATPSRCGSPSTPSTSRAWASPSPWSPWTTPSTPACLGHAWGWVHGRLPSAWGLCWARPLWELSGPWWPPAAAGRRPSTSPWPWWRQCLFPTPDDAAVASLPGQGFRA